MCANDFLAKQEKTVTLLREGSRDDWGNPEKTYRENVPAAYWDPRGSWRTGVNVGRILPGAGILGSCI